MIDGGIASFKDAPKIFNILSVKFIAPDLSNIAAILMLNYNASVFFI